MAIEVAANNPNNTDLELIGFDNLERCDIFKELVRSGELTEESSLRKSIGLNTNFFYSAECISNNKLQCVGEGCVSERGIGYLYEQDGGVFLKRILPIVNTYSDNITLPNHGSPRPFKCCDEKSTVVITCVVPPTYLEALVIPHSVLISGPDPFIPAPIQIKENSFLARLSGSIQSLCFECEEFISIIINSICKFTKQIKLKTSKLSLKRIEVEMIDLKPSENVKAVKGSLYYDNNENALKFYDGDKWRTVFFTD